MRRKLQRRIENCNALDSLGDDIGQMILIWVGRGRSRGLTGQNCSRSTDQRKKGSRLRHDVWWAAIDLAL